MSDSAAHQPEFRVWKSVLPMPDANGRSTISMSHASTPISVGLQNGEMVVWMLVQSPPENYASDPYDFIVVNTGVEFDLPDSAAFLGTVTSDNGIVWHVWTGGFRGR